ncbi:MAG: ATP-dependent helicase/nuclease subunit A [bacterium]|nr:ATP-dependent helicase/nuclease subunit A [bacterium]
MSTTLPPDLQTLLLGGMNPPQEAAVRATGQHLVIEAGAGSGKTSVLTTHYVWLLLEGATPATVDQLMLVTFTRKAAAEMQGRVRQLLQKVSQREDQSGNRARTALEQLDRAWIGTFDSLTARLLREYALLADLDPGFVILEEYAAAQLQRQSLERQLRQWQQQEGLGLAFGDIYARVAWYLSQDNASLEEFLENFIGLYERIRLGTLGHLTTEALVKSQTVSIWSWLNELQSAADDIEIPASKWDPLNGSCRLIELTRKSLPGIMLDAQSEDWEAVARQLHQLAQDVSFPGGALQVVRELRSMLSRKAIAEEILPLIVQQLSAPYLMQLADLLQAHDREYTRLKQELGVLDFLDLSLRLDQLLADPAHRWLVQRLRQRFRHLLVDEFQDTNRPQCAFLEALGDLPVRGSGAPTATRICVVGDPKQSIYGFRNADLGEYLHLRDDLLGARPDVPVDMPSPRLIRLTTNYRSRSDVLDLGNSLLAFLEADLASEMPPLFTPESQLTPGLTFPAASPEQLALLATPPDPETGAKSDALREGRLLARYLSQLVDAGTPIYRRSDQTTSPLTWGDIAVLVRTSDGYRGLEKAFREFGLPYTVVQGRGFFEAPEVQEVLQVLRLLRNAGDDIACASVLTGPLGGLSMEGLLTLTNRQGSRRAPDRVRKTLWEVASGSLILLGLSQEDIAACQRVRDLITQLRQGLLTESLSMVLERLYDASGLLTIAMTQTDGLRRFANLRQLQQFASNYPIAGQEALRQFVDAMAEFEIREARIGEAAVDVPGNGAISLLTIHAAKGLEWPMVVMLQMEKTPNSESTRWHWSPDEGLGISLPLTGIDSPVPSLTLKAIRQTLKARRDEERLRLLYVGITRAEDRLVLCGRLSSSRTQEGGPPKLVARGWLKNLYDWGQVEPGNAAPLCRDVASLGVLDTAALELLTPAGVVEPVTDANVPLPATVQEAVSRLAWTPPPPDLRPAVINVTALTAFARCPAQYAFRYEAQLPPDRSLRMRPDIRAEISAAGLGQALHQMLQLHVEGRLGETQASRDAMLPLVLAEAGITPNGPALARLATLVAGYLAHPLLASDLLTARRVFAEMSLSWWLPVPGSTSGERAYLQGKPDLLLEAADGTWRVVDYKTYTPKWEESQEESDLTPLTLQLTAYALGVSRWQGIAPESVRLEILAPLSPEDDESDGGVVLTSVAPDIALFESSLMQYLEALKSWSPHARPYVVDSRCFACGYHERCPGFLERRPVSAARQ